MNWQGVIAVNISLKKKTDGLYNLHVDF
jgi:hypothetical protein